MKKIRNTAQRKLVLDSVIIRHDHPNADAIYQEIHQIDEHISRATVYRNLNLLAKQGRIRHVPPLEGADCYDYRLDKHYHFQCKCCGVINDIEVDYLEKLDQKVSENGLYIIEEHQLMFKGICSDCANDCSEI